MQSRGSKRARPSPASARIKITGFNLGVVLDDIRYSDRGYWTQKIRELDRVYAADREKLLKDRDDEVLEAIENCIYDGSITCVSAHSLMNANYLRFLPKILDFIAQDQNRVKKLVVRWKLWQSATRITAILQSSHAAHLTKLTLGSPSPAFALSKREHALSYAIATSPSLRKLDIIDMDIGFPSGSLLTIVRRNTRLTTLSLPQCFLTDEATILEYRTVVDALAQSPSIHTVKFGHASQTNVYVHYPPRSDDRIDGFSLIQMLLIGRGRIARIVLPCSRWDRPMTPYGLDIGDLQGIWESRLCDVFSTAATRIKFTSIEFGYARTMTDRVEEAACRAVQQNHYLTIASKGDPYSMSAKLSRALFARMSLRRRCFITALAHKLDLDMLPPVLVHEEMALHKRDSFSRFYERMLTLLEECREGRRPGPTCWSRGLANEFSHHLQ